jgi:hypothetical protein
MKNIHLFIEHIVNNWSTELQEAYAPAIRQRLLDKFKQEADDLNQDISDEQLGKWIDRFDQIKNSPKITEKDLFKYTFGQLRKLITTAPGADAEEQTEDTPDVVYHEGDIIIWNGSKEGNCVAYGRGERWCITRGSFSNYRYSKDRGYPVFYLAKNESLPSNNALSFVAIQVRDTPNNNEKYVYTNRVNSPYESSPMGFSELVREIPWLSSVPNLQSILKYIPLSSTEKATQVYGKDSIGVREWTTLPFETKKQYLIVRKDKVQLFTDISTSAFIQKYLCAKCDPNYPEISKFISVTPGIIPSNTLLSNIEYFSGAEQKSILENNLRNKISTSELSSDSLSFDLKKVLVYKNGFDLASNERIYVTKDKNAIVKLKFGDTISAGLYTKDADYPNIKINKNNAKYLLDYPEIDKIPFKSTLELFKNEVVDREFINKILEKSQEDPNSTILLQTLENGDQIIIDGNTFTAWKLEGNRIESIPVDSEEAQAALNASENSRGLQQAAYNLVRDGNQIPTSIEKEPLFNLLRSLPYPQRTGFQTNNNSTLIVGSKLFWVPSNAVLPTLRLDSAYQTGNNWRVLDSYDVIRDEEDARPYFDFLRSQNLAYTDSQLAILLDDRFGTYENKLSFIKSNPPISPTNIYIPVIIPKNGEEMAVLLNRNNPSDSKTLGKRGRLIRASVTPNVARQALQARGAQAAPAAPEAPPAAAAAMGAGQAVAEPLRRRGRPQGGGNAQAPQAPAAAGADANAGTEITQILNNLTPDDPALATAFDGLPIWARRPLSRVNAVALGNDRGASRRNNLLRGAGRVIGIFESTTTPSKMYIIRLASGLVIASIVIQPGNAHLIMRPNGDFIRLTDPSTLAATLQQNNLNEELTEAAVRLHMAHNPSMIKEKLKTK